MIADTAFLIDVMAGDDAAVAKLDELIDREEHVFMPAPALHELYYGARLHARPDRERARIEDIERALPVLDFDAAAARLAGTLEGDLVKRGRKADRADVQIAAIALQHGEPVLTRDRRFPRIDGLAIERY